MRRSARLELHRPGLGCLLEAVGHDLLGQRIRCRRGGRRAGAADLVLPGGVLHDGDDLRLDEGLEHALGVVRRRRDVERDGGDGVLAGLDLEGDLLLLTALRLAVEGVVDHPGGEGGVAGHQHGVECLVMVSELPLRRDLGLHLPE